jgi:hypothetical protein
MLTCYLGPATFFALDDRARAHGTRPTFMASDIVAAAGFRCSPVAAVRCDPGLPEGQMQMRDESGKEVGRIPFSS